MLFWGVAVLVALICGASIAVAPTIAFFLLAVCGLGLLIGAPLYLWVGAALLAATTSRVFVSFLGIPAYLNFLHFPLVLAAAGFAALKSKSTSGVARSLRDGLVALFVLSLVSWAINGGEFARPLLNWLVLCEPYLLIFAILKLPQDPRVIGRLWGVVLFAICAQLPLGLWQVVTVGWADHVQGTFVGMGAGAHVAGALALVGTLILLVKGVLEVRLGKRYLWLLGAALLFLLPILADAKQVIAAAVPAVVVGIATCSRVNRIRAGMGVLLLALLVFLGFSFYGPLHRMGLDQDLLARGLTAKFEGIKIVSEEASGHWGSLLFGLGPGNTVSRVALLTAGGLVNSDSLVQRLGLGLHPVTKKLLIQNRTEWISTQSSLFSVISSWLGLLGDLGLLGVGVYVWMAFRLWGATRGRLDWQASSARGILLMAGLLGGLYSWLEEPGFTLVVGAVVGLALIRTPPDARKSRSATALGRSERRLERELAFKGEEAR